MVGVVVDVDDSGAGTSCGGAGGAVDSVSRETGAFQVLMGVKGLKTVKAVTVDNSVMMIHFIV